MQQQKSLKQTPYWFVHRQPTYLMYLKDIAMRIDPAHHLKSSIDTYIQEATALQATFLEIEVDSKKTQSDKLQEEIGKVDQELQGQMSQILRLKMELVGQSKQSAKVEQILTKYLSAIYNQLVLHLNHLLASQVGRTTLGRPSLLQEYNTHDEFNFNKVESTLRNNNGQIKNCIEELKKSQKQIGDEKEGINQSIVKLFQKGGKLLFEPVKKRIESTKGTLCSIGQLQTEVEQLDSSIKKLQEIQGRKMANIGLYSVALELKEKEPLRLSRVSLPQSSDSQWSGGSVDSEPVNNPKIVFSHDKPHKGIWVLLAIWFIALLVCTDLML